MRPTADMTVGELTVSLQYYILHGTHLPFDLFSRLLTQELAALDVDSKHQVEPHVAVSCSSIDREGLEKSTTNLLRKVQIRFSCNK